MTDNIHEAIEELREEFEEGYGRFQGEDVGMENYYQGALDALQRLEKAID